VSEFIEARAVPSCFAPSAPRSFELQYKKCVRYKNYINEWIEGSNSSYWMITIIMDDVEDSYYNLIAKFKVICCWFIQTWRNTITTTTPSTTKYYFYTAKVSSSPTNLLTYLLAYLLSDWLSDWLNEWRTATYTIIKGRKQLSLPFEYIHIKYFDYFTLCLLLALIFIIHIIVVFSGFLKLSCISGWKERRKKERKKERKAENYKTDK
jgi:hypothetical protein